MSEPDYRAEMQLPPGKTCADCVHTARCCAMFGHVPEDTYCDWWPSKYRARTPELAVSPTAQTPAKPLG